MSTPTFDPPPPSKIHRRSRLSRAWPGKVDLLDPPGRALMFRIVLGIVALEPLFIIAVLWLIGVKPWIIAVIVGAVVVGIPLLGAGIVAALWTPCAKRYPPQPIADSAVGKSFQSFGFGVLSRFNNCIHIAVDEQHLHLIPMKPLQLCGARPASLAWDRLSPPHPALIPGFMKAQIDGQRIFGPAWCLQFVNDPDR